MKRKADFGGGDAQKDACVSEPRDHQTGHERSDNRAEPENEQQEAADIHVGIDGTAPLVMASGTIASATAIAAKENALKPVCPRPL